MKSCDYCGRDNRDDATHCQECGTNRFVVSKAPAMPPRKVARPDPDPDVPPDGESQLCVSCLFPNLKMASVCKRCGVSLSAISTIGPLEQAYAEGHAFRQAVEGRPKFVVLVGIWLLFFPVFLLALVLMFTPGAGGLAPFFLGGALALFCLVMLYRSTRNFFKHAPINRGDTTRL